MDGRRLGSHGGKKGVAGDRLFREEEGRSKSRMPPWFLEKMDGQMDGGRSRRNEFGGNFERVCLVGLSLRGLLDAQEETHRV